MGILASNSSNPDQENFAKLDLILNIILSILLMIAFLICTICNPTIMQYKFKTAREKISDVLILIVVICDFITNVYFPIYYTVKLFMPIDKDDVEYKIRTSATWYDFFNTMLIDFLIITSTASLGLLSVFRYFVIEQPIRVLSKTAERVIISVVLSALIMLILGYTIYDMVANEDHQFNRYIQRVDMKVRGMPKLEIQTVVAGVPLMYNVFAITKLLCHRYVWDSRASEERNQKSAKIIITLNMGVVIYYFGLYGFKRIKDARDKDTMYDDHEWAVLEFIMMCLVPCLLGAYNSITLFCFDSHIRRELKRKVNRATKIVRKNREPVPSTSTTM